MKYKTLLFAFITLLLVVSILSLTIGRELVSQKQPTLTSFSVVHFSGYLFFIVMPVEALIPYYISEGYFPLLLLLIAIGSAIIAQIIDYAIGFLVSDRVIHDWIGRWRYNKVKKHIDDYGHWAILVFNLLPLSSPILSLVAGMVKYPLRRMIIYSLIGLSVKYFAIAYIFVAFWA